MLYTTSFSRGFATISESLRHDSFAVMAYLQDALDFYMPQLNDMKTLHIISDGPTTQYKNRTMFYLITQKLPRRNPQIKELTYNFSEAGHRKGPADGIGTTIKRICDNEIKYGQDISDLSSFLSVIKK